MHSAASGILRLQGMFNRLASRGSGGLATYVVAGDPNLDTTAKLLDALPAAGADLIELGFPFSDPLAEGAAIQEAHNRALRAGTRLSDIFGLVAEWRSRNCETPLLLMGYLNPLLQHGIERFVEEAADCGVDGLIIVDLPYESADLLITTCSAKGLANVLIIAPTTSDERAEQIARSSTGFVYCAATSGTTGSQHIDVKRTRARLDWLRTVSNRPVGVGFGIQTAADVRAVQEFADLAIVGSVLVREIGHASHKQAVDAAANLTQQLAGSQACTALSNA
jgi:tryptophan synthase alpha chain